MLAKLVLIACMCLSAESLHLRSQPSSSHSRRGRNLALTDKTRYVPGSDGTYAQNYQDVWAAALAKHNGWDASSTSKSVDGCLNAVPSMSGVWQS
mmetsp:Transcript_78727/g.148540  ORF Transcript_78727/g.148540 Transcript_78727/m.148540 type:complete len:95 (+) Transcript_78727:69-353(+)